MNDDYRFKAIVQVVFFICTLYMIHILYLPFFHKQGKHHIGHAQPDSDHSQPKHWLSLLQTGSTCTGWNSPHQHHPVLESSNCWHYSFLVGSERKSSYGPFLSQTGQNRPLIILLSNVRLFYSSSLDGQWRASGWERVN